MEEEKLAIRARAKYEALIGPIRERARELGYAIGVHGSLTRDIDLIACPWTVDAVDAKVLAEAAQETIAKHNNGIAFLNPREAVEGEDGDWFRNGCQPHGKPHGRYVWCYHLGGGPCFS